MSLHHSDLLRGGVQKERRGALSDLKSIEEDVSRRGQDAAAPHSCCAHDLI
jgi:hypothetical protein